MSSSSACTLRAVSRCHEQSRYLRTELKRRLFGEALSLAQVLEKKKLIVDHINRRYFVVSVFVQGSFLTLVIETIGSVHEVGALRQVSCRSLE